MYYSNKYQLFCTYKQLAGGKMGGMVCESLLKHVNNNGYDAKPRWNRNLYDDNG